MPISTHRRAETLRLSFLEGLPRVFLALSVGNFACALLLYLVYWGEGQTPYTAYMWTLTATGCLFTVGAILSRSERFRGPLSHICGLILFLQTCVLLYQERSLVSPVTLFFPVLCGIATPLLGRRGVSYFVAALSVFAVSVLCRLKLGPTEHWPSNDLSLIGVLGVVLVFTSSLSEMLWSGIIAREVALEIALETLAKKNAEMELWVERLGRAGSLISSGRLTTEIPHSAPSQVFDELTQSMEQMQAKLSGYFTNLFLQDRLNSIGVLASGVAHELNTPLTSLHFILENEPNLSPNTKQEILEQLGRMSSIAKGLLTFARPSVPSRTDLNEIVTKTLQLLQHGPATQVAIHLTKSPEPLFVLAHPNEIQQVLLNLFHNAMDAVESKPQGQINIRTSLEGQVAILEVGDNGCGIEESALNKILDPFFTTKSPGKGTGLGLFIVHQIVQRHAAAIEIESRKDHGTCVRLRFPLHTTAAESEAA